MAIPARVQAQGKPVDLPPKGGGASSLLRVLLAGFVLASLSGAMLCFAPGALLAEEPLKLPDSGLEPVQWSDLQGWEGDDHLAAFAAYQTSCQALRNVRLGHEHGPI
jgi:hypothetical protein